MSPADHRQLSSRSTIHLDRPATAMLVNVALALMLGAARPTGLVIAAALALGAISYGVSIVLDAYALRLLGAAREAAVFATGPFIGAIIAIPLLSEMLTLTQFVAGVVMAGGVVVLLRERHELHHVHEPLSLTIMPMCAMSTITMSTHRGPLRNRTRIRTDTLDLSTLIPT